MRKKIMLVDDNVAFLDSTKDVLESEGFQVVTATNGQDALDLAGKHQFKVILMDINMPGLNGVETFLKMKAQNPDVRVILVTAYYLNNLISQAREEGVLAVLTKPLDMPKLLETIAAVQNNGNGGCILLADDNQAFCESLSDSLRKAGYKVKTAYDSNQVKSIAAAERFDILLLDMKLPPDNGLEIYRYIKRIQPNLVTIIVTGYAEEMAQMIDQTLDENAHTLLTKPIEIAKLLKILKEVFDTKRDSPIQKPEMPKP